MIQRTMTLNYTDDEFAQAEAFLKTQEGSVLVSNKDKTIVINLMAFIDDLITRKITQHTVDELSRPKILGSDGFRVN